VKNERPPPVWKCRGRTLLPAGRTLIMGVLNVTPDSFSDGGRFAALESALAHAARMLEEGADIVDVGGESTRPGAEPVPAEEEIRRIAPVVRELGRDARYTISIDTRKAAVARAALEVGAHIVNDISALADPGMMGCLRAFGAGAILMHMQGEPQTMQESPTYRNVVAEVRTFLTERCMRAVEAGLAAESLAVDPGIGFGKTLEHNLELLVRLPETAPPDRPIVVGVSRKRMLGALTGRDVGERLPAGLAVQSWCVWRGANVLRVHDVKESCDGARVADTLRAEALRHGLA